MNQDSMNICNKPLVHVQYMVHYGQSNVQKLFSLAAKGLVTLGETKVT